MPAKFEIALIVPVYNEEAIIVESLTNKIAALEQMPYKNELIAVSDGSRDNSAKLIDNLIDTYGGPTYLRCIRKEANEGYGAAVWQGIINAESEYIVCLPVDVAVSKAKLEEIYKLLLNQKVVACYRTAKPGNSLASILGSLIYQSTVRLFFNLNIRDLNWVHAFPASIFAQGGIVLKNKRIFFLAEALIKCRWMGYDIVEVNLEPEIRTNRKGHSQNYRVFFRAVKDFFNFLFARILKGKQRDL